MESNRNNQVNGAKSIYKKFSKLTEEQRQAFEEIKTLRKQGKYEEGKEIGKKFANIPEIQSQVIKICILNAEYQEAIRIGSNFPNNHVIQSQLITIYIKQGKYEEAKRLCEKFPNYSAIQSQKVTIYKRGKI